MITNSSCEAEKVMLEQVMTGEELAFKLKGVSNKVLAAFSYRMLLYVVPLLALREKNGQFLWYWSGQNRRENLLLIFRAIDDALYWIVTQDSRKQVSANSLFLMAEEAADTADRFFIVAESVENIDAAVAISDWVDSANAVARVIMAIAYLSEAIESGAEAADFVHTIVSSINALAYYGEGVSETMSFEIDRISKLSDIRDYVGQAVRLPQGGQSLLESFLKAVTNLSQEFEYWSKWVQDRIEGVQVAPEQFYLSADVPE